MTKIRPLLPTITLASGLSTLGMVGLAIEPGSIVLIGIGSAMITARR